MSLEVLNNRTEHTHENEQFRRVVELIETSFEKLGYEGVLIGNPFNESYYRFRADAILFYNNGLVIIDFKNYRGIISLPPIENEFHNEKWHNESEIDRSRLEIKAGSRFINPFKQLLSYRKAFKEVIEKNKYLNGVLNPARICIANIFSGPIELQNEIPRNLPYYKILQESELGEFLYDFASPNAYSIEIASLIKNIFPTEKWIKNFQNLLEENSVTNKIIEIEKDVEKEIHSFLTDIEASILVLESMQVIERDSWVRYLKNAAIDNNIPQVETWSHSSRISKKILNRSCIETDGIYSVIYGGTPKVEDETSNNTDIEEKDEELLEIIPIKSNEFIDNKALIIIHEAHLINRSLNQSELLRFGTGRLLEDIVKFIDSKSNRKVVFIGDPYLLSYGKNEDSALNLELLSEIFDLKKIKHFRKEIDHSFVNNKQNLALNLAQSIENSLFNNLEYNFDDDYLKEIQSDDIQDKLKLWFDKPLINEPQNAVLFYSKKDCLQTNNWIKKLCIINGDQLAAGDLLIANNNITIPDDNGFTTPKKIVNGMYVCVLAVKESKSEFISIKQTKNLIQLQFTKLSVKCLSLDNKTIVDLWIFDNYFKSSEDLSRDEKIAFRIFINQKLIDNKKKYKFEDSKEYQQLLAHDSYRNLSLEEQTAIKKLIQNYSLSKDNKEKIETTKYARKVLGDFNKEYTQRLFLKLRETDPFVNALYVKYGWAITVHKALGSYFDDVIIKGYRRENDGTNNDDYFRWLYSAVMSSNNRLFINSPQRINPVQNCEFVDNSDINTISTEKRALLNFSNYSIDERFISKYNSIDNQNVTAAICEISKLLGQKGYLLDNSKNYSAYLTKAFYSLPQSMNKQLILAIDNKGSKDNFAVGSIRIEKSDNTEDDFINLCIQKLFQKQANTMSSFELLSDFRKEIYVNWFSTCQRLNMSIAITESHENQDIFLITNENGKLRFRVWYGTSESSHSKGFLSKIEVLEKSSEEIVKTVRNIIYG
jgi:hypothetical protein